jgi:hypothetical protein
MVYVLLSLKSTTELLWYQLMLLRTMTRTQTAVIVKRSRRIMGSWRLLPFSIACGRA